MPFICPDCHVDLSSNVECQNCKWRSTSKEGIPVLISNVDAHSDLFSDYLENYDSIANDDLEKSIQDIRYIMNQATKLISYLPNLRGKSIAEIGVGQGRLFNMLMDSDCNSVTGVDIAVDYLTQIDTNYKSNLYIANAENLPFRDEFDLIIATDILEHVLNVGDFMISLNRSMKMGGSCVIRVPYLENLLGYAQQNNCPYRFVHLRTFDKDTLMCILQPAGFSLKSCHYDGYLMYNIRGYPTFIKNLIHRYLNRSYQESIEVSSIHNLLGRILMQPMEIVVVVEKTQNL